MLQLGRHRGRQLVFGPFSFFLEFLGSFLVGLFFLDFLGSFCWHVTRSWQSGDSCWPRHPSLSLSTQGSRHSANSLISSTLIPILLFSYFSDYPIFPIYPFSYFPIFLFSHFPIFHFPILRFFPFSYSDFHLSTQGSRRPANSFICFNTDTSIHFFIHVLTVCNIFYCILWLL